MLDAQRQTVASSTASRQLERDGAGDHGQSALNGVVTTYRCRWNHRDNRLPVTLIIALEARTKHAQSSTHVTRKIIFASSSSMISHYHSEFGRFLENALP
jgi:hypothetical protein